MIDFKKLSVVFLLLFAGITFIFIAPFDFYLFAETENPAVGETATVHGCSLNWDGSEAYSSDPCYGKGVQDVEFSYGTCLDLQSKSIVAHGGQTGTCMDAIFEGVGACNTQITAKYTCEDGSTEEENINMEVKEEVTSHDHKECAAGEVYWADSNGNIQWGDGAVEDCTTSETCGEYNGEVTCYDPNIEDEDYTEKDHKICYSGDVWWEDSNFIRQDRYDSCSGDCIDYGQGDAYCEEDSQVEVTCSYGGQEYDVGDTREYELIDTSYKSVCSDDGTWRVQIVDVDESSTSDQVQNIVINKIESPDAASSGDEITVGVEYENVGGSDGKINSEVCIYPESWKGSAFSMFSINAFDIKNPCPANDFCEAKKIEADSGSSGTATYKLEVQNPDTTDQCNNLGSAWGDSFKVVAGTYTTGGEGYSEKMTEPIYISSKETNVASELVKAWILRDGGCEDVDVARDRINDDYVFELKEECQVAYNNLQEDPIPKDEQTSDGNVFYIPHKTSEGEYDGCKEVKASGGSYEGKEWVFSEKTKCESKLSEALGKSEDELKTPSGFVSSLANSLGVSATVVWMMIVFGILAVFFVFIIIISLVVMR